MNKKNLFVFFKVKGFSLIELLTVVAIIGILASLAIANYGKYIKSTHKTAMHLELSEIAKNLEYARAADGGYHKRLYTMGYRPDNKPIAFAGFTPQPAPYEESCDLFNKNNLKTGTYLTISGDADGKLDFRSLKNAVSSAAICHYLGTNACSKPKGWHASTKNIGVNTLAIRPYRAKTAVSACSAQNSPNKSLTDPQYTVSSCDTYTFVAVSPYRGGFILMARDQAGKTCYMGGDQWELE